jgi:hypothetical protein
VLAVGSALRWPWDLVVVDLVERRPIEVRAELRHKGTLRAVGTHNTVLTIIFMTGQKMTKCLRLLAAAACSHLQQTMVCY